MPVIESLEIEKFRSLPKEAYILGSRITIIAGQNATGKSTLLGMLGQPFGVKDSKDIWGNVLKTEFREIFKISPVHDSPGDHVYKITTLEQLHPEGKTFKVSSYRRSPDKRRKKPIAKGALEEIRFVTGTGRKGGDGNVDKIPVIYLGLKRVFPLGETAESNVSASGLSPEEEDFFKEWHSKILLEVDSSLKSQSYMSKNEKSTLGIKTDQYDSLTISAGQDNVGKIIGAIISLMRFKDEAEYNYKGAILLIDEVDVTMHAASQKLLGDFLFKMARENDIQIILTTHSIDFIEHMINHRDRNRRGNDIVTWHLLNPRGKVLLSQNPSICEFKRMINLQLANLTHIDKLEAFCEDDEAILFLKCLLPKYISERTKFIPLKKGYGEVKKLANMFGDLHPAVWIVDGDQSRASRDSNSIVILPGGASIERVFYDLLESLDANDDFWTKDYLKQDFISRKPQSAYDRMIYKKWFNDERSYWGRALSRIYKKWSSQNTAAVNSFIEEYVVAYNRSAKIKGLPLLNF
ncbi:AAA family ATPase [uncultured Cloacibacillus sp.]|uniref:AAA family ATPase n=1 Tax=uncultured Cloacibacillus sp. TaxID=889794 RepID=UPI00258BC6D3|nr:AAA family ATPase [uncultured Cloacibacillus sp.]